MIGEIISYLGKNYKLKVVERDVGKIEVRFYRGCFEAFVSSEMSMEERQEIIWDKLNLYPNSIRIKEQKSL